MKAPSQPPVFASPCVVDTNVILVANGQHPGVSEACVQACRERLARLMSGGRIVLDDAFEILHEYRHKTDPEHGRWPGDAFVRWVLHHVDDPSRVERIHLEPDPVWGYASFPRQEALWSFDAADRKFVAVARAHPAHPPILQAADSKWLDWSAGLAAAGVSVCFLCEGEVRAFHRHKFGH